ncbi:hypothetical protein HYE77_07570 [Pseudomonas sp. IPO3774]|nr:hypothetical protein [Pseudomonas sp. IPO3774]
MQLTLIAAVFNCATEGHAALVFLLAAGLDGAVAFFVLPSHFESPNASKGSSGWARAMTVWRHGDDRTMNLAGQDPIKMWERACSRMRRASQHIQ